MIIHEERFGGSLAFVVTGTRADWIDCATVALRLWMHLRIAIDLTRRCLQNFCSATLGHAKHIDGPHHGCLHRLDRVVLVVARCGRTGKVVDFIYF